PQPSELLSAAPVAASICGEQKADPACRATPIFHQGASTLFSAPLMNTRRARQRAIRSSESTGKAAATC
ncbi:MAG: hypothetical protein ACREP9_10210, partial [Candidatus Dormibacteraceae bacterium]